MKFTEQVRAKVRKLALVGCLLAATPLMMGGCQEFRDQSVTAVETATRGLIDAVVTAYFEALRSDAGN